MKIEWSEASTKRGIIWVATAGGVAGGFVWPVAPTKVWA